MSLSVTLIATDTIAPLTLISAKQYPTLFSVVFGEGVMNDAVALLLMNVVLDIKKANHASGQESGQFMAYPGITSTLVLDFFKNFIIKTLTSVGFGFFMGTLLSSSRNRVLPLPQNLRKPQQTARTRGFSDLHDVPADLRALRTGVPPASRHRSHLRLRNHSVALQPIQPFR
jgi:hypothetical protein